MSNPNETLTEEFRRSGWLPANGDALSRWIRDKLELARKDPDAPLLPCIEDLQSIILNDGDMYMGFNRMFENATQVKSYEEMLLLMNQILREAPTYGDVGPPFYMVLAEAMNTDGGFTAFMAVQLNEQFKRIFDDWADFLISPGSTSTLTDAPGGWFSVDAIAAMSYGFDLPFDAIFVCDPSKPHWGYTSWDNFFVRALNPGVRPLELPDQDNIISAPCESIFYHTQTKVKEQDQFWIKGEPYSLRHMLADPDLGPRFYGGTVLQAFLQMTGYHRWHSPVGGTIVKIVTVPGTYFAQSPALLNSPLDPEHNPYLQSLAFVTSITTRMLIFIEASNPTIGLTCFVAVGLTEVSTCEATVIEGQSVKRGEELGMFHLGGSAQCLVFGPEVDIKWEGSITEPGKLIRVRSAIGVAQGE